MSSLSTLERPPAPQTPDTRRREGRRLDLDVVRGVAILLALGWHFNHGSSGNRVLDALQFPGTTLGWAGVDLFFVLSGFLLGRLVLKEHFATGRFDGRRFTIRRMLKLWPVLYVFLAVQAVAGPESWTTFLWQNALHIQNYAGTSLRHLWSLAVEEHFYLVLAVLFPCFARRRGSPRLLVGVLVGVLVAALALRIWGTTLGVSEVRLQWRTHFRVDSLAAGVLLAGLSGRWAERVERRAARAGRGALARAVRAAGPPPLALGRSDRRRRRHAGAGGQGRLLREHRGLHRRVPHRRGVPAPPLPRQVGRPRPPADRSDGRHGPLLLRHLHLAPVRRAHRGRPRLRPGMGEHHPGRTGGEVRGRYRGGRRRDRAGGEARAPAEGATRPVASFPSGRGVAGARSRLT